MDTETGQIVKDPTPDEMKRRKLVEIRRPLTEHEERTQKIGRNSPCGCGSGVKFKHCCYRKFERQPR